jgi:DNA-binding beta-propeller fold protein YncE
LLRKSERSHKINLPTSKTFTVQSIAILELSDNQLRDFPDDRLRGDEKSTLQSYFVGLAFSTDGKHLYASMAPTSQSGIAVYGFSAGKVTPERLIGIPAQHLAKGKTVTYDVDKNPPATAAAYPAGLAVLATASGDRLLVANNLCDNVILLDVALGTILQTFDLSTSRYVPAAYPYTVIANAAPTKAWVSLWNASAVAELDLSNGRVARRIELWRPSDPVAPGTHPRAMLLNRSGEILYVALAKPATANADGIAAVDLKTGVPFRCYRAVLGNDEALGTASVAIALSADEKYLLQPPRR